jgi:hypothetical protein
MLSLNCNLSRSHASFFLHSRSSDWELLVPLGRLSEKLGRPMSESLELYGKASESAGMVVHPIYRLHASRMKTLCRIRERPEVWSALQGLRVSDGELDSEGQEETDGSGMQEGLEILGVLKEIAKHCFLPATVRRLRGLGVKAEVKGPCEGEESEEDETGQVAEGNANAENDKASTQGLAENQGGATGQVEKEIEATENRKARTREEGGLVKEGEGEAGQVENVNEGVENSKGRTEEERSVEEKGGPGKEMLVEEKEGPGKEGLVEERGGPGKEGLVKEKAGPEKEGLVREKGGETGQVEKKNEDAEKVKASTGEEEGMGGPERDEEQAQSMEVDEGEPNAGAKLSSDGHRASAGEEGIMGGEGTSMRNTTGRPKQSMEGGGDAPNPAVRDVGQPGATVTNVREAIGPSTTKTDESEDLETISMPTAQLPASLQISTDPETSTKPASISAPLSEVWEVLFRDALAGLRFCISGEMKHFHKARYRVAHAVLVQGGGEGEQNAVEAAKAELAFFFKTGRGAFTMNVWELDAPKKKKW